MTCRDRVLITGFMGGLPSTVRRQAGEVALYGDREV